MLTSHRDNNFGLRTKQTDSKRLLFITYSPKGAIRTGWNLKACPSFAANWSLPRPTNASLPVRAEGQIKANIGPYVFHDVTVTAICDLCLPAELDLMLLDLRLWELDPLQPRHPAIKNRSRAPNEKDSPPKALGARHPGKLVCGFPIQLLGPPLTWSFNQATSPISYAHQKAFRSPEILG